MRSVFLSVLLLMSFVACAQQGNSPSIYYVGNMRVAIVKNDSVVLIDALHDYYGPYYLPSDPALLAKLRSKQKPFSNLVAITATHIHGDHFDSAMVKAISDALPAAKLVFGRQFEPLLASIHPSRTSYADDQLSYRLSPSVKINIRRINHVGGNRHRGMHDYRIELIWDGYRIVHFGDAEISANSFSGLEPGADLFIIPSWFALDNTAIDYMEKLKTKNILITHIDPNQPIPEWKTMRVPFTVFSKYGNVFTGKK